MEAADRRVIAEGAGTFDRRERNADRHVLAFFTAQQILPEEQYHHKFKEVVILYKHGITTQAKVLLEYSVEDDRHIVAIRQESDNQLHALVIFSDGTSDDE